MIATWIKTMMTAKTATINTKSRTLLDGVAESLPVEYCPASNYTLLFADEYALTGIAR